MQGTCTWLAEEPATCAQSFIHVRAGPWRPFAGPHMVATCLRSVRTTAAVGEFPHGTAAISIFGKSGQPLLVQAVPINPGELNKVTVQ